MYFKLKSTLECPFVGKKRKHIILWKILLLTT